MTPVLTSLPKEITLPSGEKLTLYQGKLAEAELKRLCRSLKVKYRTVQVLSSGLRGWKDLHNQPYKPQTYIFTALVHLQESSLEDLVV